ncbi:hypothetical protein BBO99_00001374 [Phytophthora kernoviae]|uniref:TAZ-type domain-containing protein n=1 Tax=Phytophthora kernoviae TaxID=325452 RepID=A0A3R7J5J7_9STRA|nr:hypothetical protein JM18_004353 [Phytophthora kernoviae]KAG2530539.1 hypothetical protein JM16_000862 [Phytophthora kernoviae]RLN26151.1 hypothetical protein BBI17_001243 [Phytophthora kernoviae]RLN84341.1 hypothetical protein BBO99_00001374 [Phytophthora kernoviae]
MQDISSDVEMEFGGLDMADEEMKAEETTTVKETQSKLVDLEKLLRWFPTEDPVLLEMLATRIEAALAIEDALTHRRVCQKKEKDAAASGEEKQWVCPFCIRIRQRRSLGAISALDHLNNEQRRLLQDPKRIHTAGNNVEQSQDTRGDNASRNLNVNGDYIGSLLRGKNESRPDKESVQRQFDKAMDLGYAIVDASFCAPAKAQRCLLNCQAILVHLQHHLDLKVCKQSMCASVEYHFAHLSQCKARKENLSCEYCLRVQEREFSRAVDMMEADQPEAEARVQSIINAITTSFTNDPPEEREQTLLQLEDELDQAEDDKRELADKLGTSRDNLRKVRRSLESHGMTTAGSQRLPLHFIKVRPGEGSNGSSKKRRLLGSMVVD